MPRTKILSGEEREIASLLHQKRTPEATLKHLEWISHHLQVPLWKVKTVARREGVRFE
jgi:hypothetical protein